MPDSFETDDSSLEEMRRIIAEYDACEGQESKSEYLIQQRITLGIIGAYRKTIEIIDRRKVSPPTASSTRGTSHRRSHRRRARRIPTSPPGHPGTHDRSHRNRRGRTRVTVIIIRFDLP
ncbi:hypothetical protein ACWGH2_10685 [Streptomyces sp. NPDC054871]